MEPLESAGIFLTGLPLALQGVLVFMLAVASLLYRSKLLKLPLLVRWPFSIIYTVLNTITNIIGRVLHGKKVNEQWLLYEDGPRGPVPLRVRQSLPSGAFRRLNKWEVDNYTKQNAMPAYEVDYWEEKEITEKNLIQQAEQDYWQGFHHDSDAANGYLKISSQFVGN